jgi:hypothetical protein
MDEHYIEQVHFWPASDEESSEMVCFVPNVSTQAESIADVRDDSDFVLGVDETSECFEKRFEPLISSFIGNIVYTPIMRPKGMIVDVEVIQVE